MVARTWGVGTFVRQPPAGVPVQFLARETGMPVRRTDIEMAAVLAEGDAVDRLAVAAGHPLISAVQLGFGAGNVPLFHGHILVRSDVLTLRITRQG